MTAREKIRTLHRLRDLLFDMALRKWQAEGWVIRPHLEHNPKGPNLAWVDFDEGIVHVYPHPVDNGQPVPKTLVHEILGHILFDLDGSKQDERAADAVETLLWPILTASQRQALGNLVGPAG